MFSKRIFWQKFIFLYQIKQNILAEQPVYSDNELIRELKKGNIEAFNQIFYAYSSKLYHFAYGYLKSKEDAEEMVQEIFSKIWDKRADIKEEYQFRSYLFSIAFNYIKKHLTDLVSIGFDIEIFGKNTLIIRGIPSIINHINPEALLAEVADDLEEFSSIKSVKSLKEEVLKSIACHSAFRSGDALTFDEIKALLRDFAACDLPYCPHGRPGIIRLTFDEIDKKFKRT